MAMVGVFGSKNQFGLSQGLLLMASAWIWRDKERGLLVRALVSISILLALYMLVVARSVDSFAIAVGAIICGLTALKLNRIPPKWRFPIFWGAMIFILAESVFFFAIADNLFGSILKAFGKNTSLTGRTIIWQTARKVWDENPFLGVGLNGFRVWGNAYAEDLWARFQPGRTGINFHNLWYEIVVQFGYVGLAVALLIVFRTTIEVIRWVVRSPTMTSSFYFSFVIFADIRTFLETGIAVEHSPRWPHKCISGLVICPPGESPRCGQPACYFEAEPGVVHLERQIEAAAIATSDLLV